MCDDGEGLSPIDTHTCRLLDIEFFPFSLKRKNCFDWLSSSVCVCWS